VGDVGEGAVDVVEASEVCGGEGVVVGVGIRVGGGALVWGEEGAGGGVVLALAEEVVAVGEVEAAGEAWGRGRRGCWRCDGCGGSLCAEGLVRVALVSG
jgi:hypothetical protein